MLLDAPPLQSCRNNDNHFQTIQGLVIIGNLFLDQMNVPVKKIDILSIPWARLKWVEQLDESYGSESVKRLTCVDARGGVIT